MTRLVIVEVALLTISAPETESAVVEALVRVAFREESVTVFKLLIELDALLTIRAPLTESAVVEALVNVAFVPVRVTVFRLLIELDALFAIKPPGMYATPVVVAEIELR